MTMMKRTVHILRRFTRETRGAVVVEAVLILPLLLWAYTVTFVFFDAYHAQTRNLRATYTIADLVSRQTRMLHASDIDGMNKVFDMLNNTSVTGETTAIRITDVQWDQKSKTYKVVWSDGTNGKPPQTDASIKLISDKLPVLADGDTELVVETWLTYTPAFQPIFGAGLTARTLYQMVTTRPRLSPQVKFS